MTVAPVPDAFEKLLPFEQAIYDELRSVPDTLQQAIHVSSRADTAVRGTFLRWFFVEAIPSAALSIAAIEIEQAVVGGVLDLETVKLDLLLTFIDCDFRQEIQLSDATIVGFEFVGGFASGIIADRLTIKGSMKLCSRHKSRPVKGPKLSKLRLCGAEIRGNLDLRGCSLGSFGDFGTDSAVIRTSAKNSDRRQPPLFADGLTVHGNLMLSEGFYCRGEVRLNGCQVGRNLDCSGATLSNPSGYSLSAAGAHISGSAYFCQTKDWLTYLKQMPFTSQGTLRLEGAAIDGDLDCTAGRFSAGAFLTEQAGRIPPDRELYAIAANGIRVGSDIIFDRNDDTGDTFAARGIISLISAHVGGDFLCDGASFNFPGEEPLCADGIVVEGTTFLENVDADGILRFVQANLKQGLYVDGATFDTRKPCKQWTEKQSNIAKIELGGWSCGIYAPDAKVGGIFRWTKVKARKAAVGNSFWLFVAGASVNKVEDDKLSWRKLDRFDLTGCEYETVAGLGDSHAEWRLKELDRQYAFLNKYRQPDFAVALARVCRKVHRLGLRKSLVEDLTETIARFEPESYIQLAKAFRRAGYEGAARKVLVRLERNKTRYSDIGFFHQFWRYVLDALLRYGYSPFRPVVIVLVWAAISAVLFQFGYDHKEIVAAKDNAVAQARSSPAKDNGGAQVKSTAESWPVPFNAMVYAVDTLVPIVDLNQKKNWTVRRLSSLSEDPKLEQNWWQEIGRVWRTLPNEWIGVLLIFNTFFGWLMTTLFAAGISGLLRTGNDR